MTTSDIGVRGTNFKYPRGCSWCDCDYFHNGECKLHKAKCVGRMVDCTDWEVMG
jgi:hypothetical protein